MQEQEAAGQILPVTGVFIASKQKFGLLLLHQNAFTLFFFFIQNKQRLVNYSSYSLMLKMY